MSVAGNSINKCQLPKEKINRKVLIIAQCAIFRTCDKHIYELASNQQIIGLGSIEN